MRIQNMMALVAAVGLAGFVRAAEIPEGETSASCVFALDTGSSDREVKTSADISALGRATCRAGGTVTYVRPDGSVGTLIEKSPIATSAALPINVGGLWTFVNSLEGSATFTVRHSIYGTLGEGTEASPARIVDEAELVDYAAGVGYVFTLCGTDALLGRLMLPANVCLANVGDGKMRLIASQDGCLYQWAEIAYPLDSLMDGPDREMVRRRPMPIAYSGDNWAGDVAAASTITFVSPNGSMTSLSRKGTDAERTFRFSCSGLWTIRLTMSDGTVREAMVSVLSSGFSVMFK